MAIYGYFFNEFASALSRRGWVGISIIAPIVTSKVQNVSDMKLWKIQFVFAFLLFFVLRPNFRGVCFHRSMMTFFAKVVIDF